MNTIEDSNFKEIIANGTTLVDFSAEWCGPCKMMTPVIEEFEGKHPEVSVYKLDIDANPVSTGDAGVTSVPTIIIYKDGEAKGTFVGVKDLAALEQFVESSLA